MSPYFTAWPDETGQVEYFSDIHSLDDYLRRAIRDHPEGTDVLIFDGHSPMRGRGRVSPEPGACLCDRANSARERWMRRPPTFLSAWLSAGFAQYSLGPEPGA